MYKYAVRTHGLVLVAVGAWLTFAMLLKFTRFKYFAGDRLAWWHGAATVRCDGGRCAGAYIPFTALAHACRHSLRAGLVGWFGGWMRVGAQQTNVRNQLALLRLFDFAFARIVQPARSGKVSSPLRKPYIGCTHARTYACTPATQPER